MTVDRKQIASPGRGELTEITTSQFSILISIDVNGKRSSTAVTEADVHVVTKLPFEKKQ